ncbi:HNH endonuclease [Kitasatospora griseola]|uniref:HNH endonuclease n=1 Tax=Kitasatospora griseola TaxID=2064 RepID=UPI003856072E
MIPLRRIPLSADAEKLLTKWTGRVSTEGGTSKTARELWRNAHTPKRRVRDALEPMARGNVRCMYCDDSRATDIDHFQPIEKAPLRTFDWANHLLACSYCNSNAKRELYPVDHSGTCLLIDPTAEDPADHLMLLLLSGEYVPVKNSPKGQQTIEVFGLNRRELVKGRLDAFDRACSNIRDWHLLVQDSDAHADRVARALLDSPFIDVVHAMTRLKPTVAPKVVGPRTVAALDAWRSAHGF